MGYMQDKYFAFSSTRLYVESDVASSLSNTGAERIHCSCMVMHTGMHGLLNKAILHHIFSDIQHLWPTDTVNLWTAPETAAERN